MTARVAIIGSGPGALACAWQLIARGLRPVVLDAGETLPAPTAALVNELRATWGHWRPAAVDAVTRNPTLKGQPLPKKLVFGSDFLHGHGRRHSPLVNSSFVDPTFALGGYTVAWGGAMLPIRTTDMNGWPIGEDELADGFAQVLARLPFSGSDDGLSAEFPRYGARAQQLEPTSQSRSVMRRLAALARPGLFVSGQARVAVKASDCRYCGMCLSGCPFGVIQTFDQFFPGLAAQGLIEYRGGVVVTRLADTADGVRVHAVNRHNGPLPDQHFDRVFLAAGAIGSTRIALESMQLYDVDVDMLDSQKFAVPLLVPDTATSEPGAGNTLPAVFVDMRLPSTAAHWTHLQISSFSHYALQAMKQRMKLGPLPLHGLARPLTSRLMVGWAGLHSDHSDRFRLRLLRAHQHGRPLLKLQALPTDTTRQTTRRAMAEMRAQLRAAGILALTPGAVIGPPGAGFHFGASLPMQASPTHPLHTDTHGRPNGWRHVHVVDSSVFPTIPATTMVLTIMANAWRIAARAAL